MKKIFCFNVLMLISITFLFGQVNTGTLKVFSDLQGITVYIDDVQQANYQEIKNITAGTHYVKVMNGNTKIYSQIITITKDQVTTIFVEAPKDAQSGPPANRQPEQKPADVSNPLAGNKTGTLNIYSEITGITVYLNDIKQGDDVKTINSVPAGNHYLKVMKDGVNIFGEIVTINEGQTTTVLIKNNGQVAEKVLEGKTKEREEYSGSKIDILFAPKNVTVTKGASTLFPGYYGYWGYSNSVSSTSQIADFKIVKGGVEEISDLSLAQLADNKAILETNAKDNASVKRLVNVGAPMLLIGTLTTLVYLADFILDKPILHKSPTHPAYETYVATGAIVTGIFGYAILSGSEKVIPAHYYSVQDAAKDAQDYNRKLKEKLGLPESYDVK